MSAIDDLLARAREQWPGIEITAARLGELLAERGIVPEASTRPDLALACACLDGSPKALAQFEERMLAPVTARLARTNGRQVADDVTSRLRELLFAGAAGGAPRLASYSGRGDLRGWLEVVASREVHKLRGRDVPLPDDDHILASLPDDDDLELRQIKAQHRAELSRAFREVLASLPTRSRLLLRQRYLDGLTFDDVAALHGVHRITVMRWMARIEKSLLREIQRVLVERLRLAHSEVAHLVDDARSRLDLSLRGLLESQRRVP
jgi:RNA polymerase sigma-70 factor (ECF subfamily)